MDFEYTQHSMLDRFAANVKPAVRKVVGREREMNQILAAFGRPEVGNVLLLAYPGAGKTMLVQGLAKEDTGRLYLETDLSKMLGGLADKNQMATRLKSFFDQAEEYAKASETEIVLFFDEFHQVVQLSDAAVEALKPKLADSGTRGVRVIAATTYGEYERYIAPNQPLVERLYRVNVPETNRRATVEILREMAAQYAVDHLFYDDGLYESIYEYTQRYIPADAQPRKSVLVLDAMLGWHKQGRTLDKKLLADVIYESTGVKVSVSVDASAIRRSLDERVYGQRAATLAVENRLQLVSADLNDKTRPMASFLFSGPTGVGKAIDDGEEVPVLVDGCLEYKCHGDLLVGDMVFNRKGEPAKVTGVFPQGEQQAYEIKLRDGRSMVCNDAHLWTYRGKACGAKEPQWQTAPLKAIAGEGLTFTNSRGVSTTKFALPKGGIARSRSISFLGQPTPYVIGLFAGRGRLRQKLLTLSSGDEFVLQWACHEIGAAGYDHGNPPSKRFDHTFWTGTMRKSMKSRFHTAAFFTGDSESLIGCSRNETHIPKRYLLGSVRQRWELIRGVFDGAGLISRKTPKNPVWLHTSSKRMMEDVVAVLRSLGMTAVTQSYEERGGLYRGGDYRIHVLVPGEECDAFFSSPRKLAELHRIKQTAKSVMSGESIKEIVDLKEKRPMTCIMVDDPEHLYQVGRGHIVTHNTELAKGLADLIFQSQRSLLRFDMTEYSRPDSLDRFREELTSRVWQVPYSVILLDEIEKACGDVTRLLLQVLDDGRLINRHNREISFVNSYFILTTNAASEVYEQMAAYNVDDEGSGRYMKDYFRLIRKSLIEMGDEKFPPELINRIDTLVPFQPLSENTLHSIVRKYIRELTDRVKRVHDVTVQVLDKADNSVPEYIIRENIDVSTNAGGARGAIRRVDEEVGTEIARFINAHPGVRSIGVYVHGHAQYADKNRRVSDACIKVGELQGSQLK